MEEVKKPRRYGPKLRYNKHLERVLNRKKCIPELAVGLRI
jgi:hypothetical protein